MVGMATHLFCIQGINKCGGCKHNISNKVVQNTLKKQTNKMPNNVKYHSKCTKTKHRRYQGDIMVAMLVARATRSCSPLPAVISRVYYEGNHIDTR